MNATVDIQRDYSREKIMLTMADEVTTIEVAAGVILDDQGLILVALRPQHAELGGYWEFPGGKVESGETIENALSRELAEELAIQVNTAQPFLTIEHVYAKRKVILHIFKVKDFSGEAVGNEGQTLRWVTLAELGSLQFPPANYAIVEALQQC